MRFHRKKHDEDGVTPSPTTDAVASLPEDGSASTDLTPSAGPTQVGQAEKGITEEDEEEVPQMNVVCTIVSLEATIMLIPRA